MMKVLDIDYGNGKVSRKKIQKAMAAFWARKRAAQSISSESSKESAGLPVKTRKPAGKAAVTAGA
jgi:hypothetical protein